MRKIDNIRDIPIGTKIELNVIDPVEGKINIQFVSQIEEHVDDNVIRIAAPIFEAKVYPIRVNSHIDAYIYYKSNQVYNIAGFVEKRMINESIALLDVRVTEKIRKIQRRQFFRFNCSVPVAFYGQPLTEEQEEYILIAAGRTINLSGGGLSVLTDKPLIKNTEVKGKLNLENDTIINFDGKVIRCIKNIINDEIKYISSISFIDIGYKKREKIVRFIFNQQRLLLKKGLR